MSEKTVMVTKQAEVLTVMLHRPEALNALNDEMTEELRQVLEEAAVDDSVRVVVLTGSGRAFLRRRRFELFGIYCRYGAG